MTADRQLNRARRYLLALASEEERSALEEEYFSDEQALERMELAEESLIEDYLSQRLAHQELRQFEREYVAVPHRRTRVEAIRGLIAAANPRRSMRWRGLAAAALVVVALGGLWMLRGVLVPATSNRVAKPAASESSTSTAPARRIFVLAISPTAVRSSGAGATLIIPSGVDVVRLNLEGDADTARVANARARIRSVTGGEAWSGAAALPTDAPAGTIAQVDVPAQQLPVDDYVIELFTVEASATEREVARYFLAVRAP